MIICSRERFIAIILKLFYFDLHLAYLRYMKKFFLLLFLFPAILMAQSVTKDKGGYTIDLSKKKQITKDTTAQAPDEDDVDEFGNAVKTKGKKIKTQTVKKTSAGAPHDNDFKKDGIFKGIFTAGLNACQIDGDAQWGYKYLGAEVGVGAMARFHKFLSVSMELDYTMKGAKDRLQSTQDVTRDYQVQWDYVSVPVALNAHFFTDHLTISAGAAPGVMVRYKQFNDAGINITNQLSFYGQTEPRKFDLDAFAGIQYTLKKHYGFGFKYSYSTISIRPAAPGRENGWINGQYNNVLTFRFVYILGPVRKK